MKEIKNKALKEKTSVLKKLYSYWNVFFSRKSEQWEKVNNKKKNYSFKTKFYVNLNIFLSEKKSKM